jgi:hypothetical protein
LGRRVRCPDARVAHRIQPDRIVGAGLLAAAGGVGLPGKGHVGKAARRSRHKPLPALRLMPGD